MHYQTMSPCLQIDHDGVVPHQKDSGLAGHFETVTGKRALRPLPGPVVQQP
jgi:hypothetical protein